MAFSANLNVMLRLVRMLHKIFSTPTGQEVLKYFRSITIEMVNGPNVSTEELRHIEGQRYLVGLIEHRIAHANRSKQ